MITSSASNVVALLVPADWEEMHAAKTYNSGLLGPLRTQLAAAGYTLELYRLSESGHAQDVEDFEEYLAEHEPAAFIVARVLENDPVIDLLVERRMNFVLYGFNSQSGRLPWVDIDNTAAFWLSTRKCIEAGHRRIALLNGPALYSYAQRREQGYRRALNSAAIECEPALILNGPPTFAMGASMAAFLLRQSEPVTAFVCTTDEMALGAMASCIDLGLTPGVDISIVGYGNTEGAQGSTPRLATLDYNFKRVASLLCGTLLHQLEPNRYLEVASRRLIPVQWVEGGSLGPMLVDPTKGASRHRESSNLARLKHEIASLNRAQQVSLSGSWWFDLSSQEFVGSAEFYSILGNPNGQALTLVELLERLLPQSASSFKQAWGNAVHGRALDIEVQAQIGALTRSLHWRGEVICSGGKIVYAEGALQDITDLARTRRELEEYKLQSQVADKAKDEFLANMSHEIRTPIHAVMGLTDVLKRQLEVNNPARATADKISKASHALLNVINDVLLVSKVNSGTFALDSFQFDLQQILDEIEATAAGLLSRKPVQFTLNEIPPEYRYLIGDPLRLRQVLVNLVGNACKFTAKGRIELRVLAQGIDDKATLRFEVRDTGIGIAEERLSELFNPFVQADSSTTRVYGGTGLGLTISKSLVNLMGGAIQVESELGRGSSFAFELSFPRGLPNSVDLTNSDQLRVMIIDDSPSSVLYSAEIVRQLGWLPTLFESGQSALDELESQPDSYDFILLDYQMPGMSGFEVARELRASPWGAKLNLIILTALDLKKLELSLPSYVDAILSKPLTADLLLDVVGRLDPINEGSVSDRPRINTAVDPEIGVAISEADTQPDSTLVRDSSAPSLRGINVLAVDDSDINLELIEEMLISLGAGVTTALDGGAALKLLESDHAREFDLLLCDLQMPGMDGFELTQQVVQLERYQSLPIIAVSAGGDTLTRQRARDAGMQTFLEKPFDRSRLEVAVLEALWPKESSRAVEPQNSSTLRVSGKLFDPDIALNHWSSSKPLAKQLKKFSESYGDAELVERLVSEFHYDKALNYLHKLRGVASILGLLYLAEIAMRLELLLRQPVVPNVATRARILVTKMVSLHRDSLEAIHHWLAEHPHLLDEAPSGKIIELETLREALKSFDPVASEVCLYADVRGLPDQVLAQVRESVRHFDFKRALALLETPVDSEPG